MTKIKSVSVQGSNQVSTPKQPVKVETSKTRAASSDTKSTNTSNQLAALAKQFGILPFDNYDSDTPTAEERAQRANRLRLIRKQLNLESIISIALGFKVDSHSRYRIDADWFDSFLQLAEHAGNKMMQTLWAKILVNEVSQPGSFSLKTLQTLKSMTIHEARQLAKACSLAVRLQHSDNLRIITGYQRKAAWYQPFAKSQAIKLNLSQFGLSYADVLALVNLGVIYSEEIESSALNPSTTLHFVHQDKILDLTARYADTTLQFYRFTATGAELAKLISEPGNDDYYQQLNLLFSPSFALKADNI